MIVAHLVQEAITYNWVNCFPAEEAAALVAFHFARETDISHNIVVKNVEKSENASYD